MNIKLCKAPGLLLLQEDMRGFIADIMPALQEDGAMEITVMNIMPALQEDGAME